MEEIEVEWNVKPKSGVTSIELSDLNCKTKKEWDALTKKEQEKRINKALIETDGNSLKPIAVTW